MPRSEEFQADRKTRRNRVERKKPSKADNESEVLTESDNDNEEGEEEATGGNKWRCLKMVVVSAVLILVVYGMLGFIISNEVDDQGPIETQSTLGGKNEARCGADSFMLRDGICDEMTNTERCLWDGGDCCLDKNKVDKSMCQTCTCKTDVDIYNLKTIFKEYQAMTFLDPADFQRSILKTEKSVEEVLAYDVCSALCLDSSLNEVVNGWMYNKETSMCTCSWLKSISCIHDIAMTEMTSPDHESIKYGFEIVQAYVLLGKVLECKCLRKGATFMATATGDYYLTKSIPETLSPWHCHRACDNDAHCTTFSWGHKAANKEECKLMPYLPHQGALVANDTWITGSLNCSSAELFFGETTTTTTTTISTTTATTSAALEHCNNYDLGYVRSSSVYSCKVSVYGPQNALDQDLMDTDWMLAFAVVAESYFRSGSDDSYPWLEIAYDEAVSVIMVMLIPLYNNEQIKNLKVHIGNSSATYGELSTNQVCATLDDTILSKTFKVLECEDVLVGQYILVQMQDNSQGHGLAFQEVTVFLAISTNEVDQDVDQNIFNDSFAPQHPDNKETVLPTSQMTLTSSSVYNNDNFKYGPHLLTDGLLSTYNYAFFSSVDTSDQYQPWIQMDMKNTYIVNRIVVINRIDCCGERFHDIQVLVGPKGWEQRHANDLCTTFDGPSHTGAVEVLNCEEPVQGKILILLIDTYGTLNLEEIIIMGALGTATGPTTESGTTIDEPQIQSSSILDSLHGPENAFDGVVMDNVLDYYVEAWAFFHSNEEDPHPWIQLDYGSQVHAQVGMVMLTTTSQESIENIKVHVGDTASIYGQLSTNQVCSDLDGIIEPDHCKVLTCDQIVSGQYVLVQMQENNDGNGMVLDEVIVFFNYTMPNGQREAFIQPYHIVHSSASSIYEYSDSIYGPHFLYDAWIPRYDENFFHTNVGDAKPWVKLRLDSAWLLTRLVVTQRTSCCGNRFHHMEVHVGFDDQSMTLCTRFEGPSKTGAQDMLICDEPVQGESVRISSYVDRDYYDPLNFNEVLLFGAQIV